jgi:hypothetical protein
MFINESIIGRSCSEAELGRGVGQLPLEIYLHENHLSMNVVSTKRTTNFERSEVTKSVCLITLFEINVSFVLML